MITENNRRTLRLFFAEELKTPKEIFFNYPKMKHLLLFLVMLPAAGFCQCLQVNVGIIIDTLASPCNGPVTLDAHHSGASFLWSTGDTTQTIEVRQEGNYWVWVDQQGCTGTDTVSVSFENPPKPDLGPAPAPVCGKCISLDAGTGGTKYQWSTGATSQKINVCEPGNYTVWVTVFSKDGCKSSDSVNISIKPGLKTGLPVDTSVCGDSLKLEGYNKRNWKYHWNTGDSTSSIFVEHSGTYFVTVYDSTGCQGIDTSHVKLFDRPTLILVPSTYEQCGGCISVKAITGANLINWSTGSNQTDSIFYCETGKATLYATASDSNECQTSDSVSLEIAPGPKVDLGKNIFQCGGTVVLKSNLPGRYFWSTSDTTSQITVSESGTYWLRVTDPRGCEGSDTVLVTIAPVPNAYLGTNPSPRCGGCFNLHPSEQSKRTIYQWSTGGTSPEITYCLAGEHSVWVKVIDTSGCEASDTINLSIKPGYKVNLGKDTTQCGGLITLTAPYPSASWIWNTGESTQSITVDSSGIYQVSVYHLPGCSASDTISGEIQVTFVPELNAPASIQDLSGNCPEKTLKAATVAGADTYEWAIPGNWKILTGQGTREITLEPPSTGSGTRVYVSVKNQYGCISAQKDTLIEAPDMQLFIPNAFTPNNDGINDRWEIRNINYFPENNLVVLNRWGNEVYRQTNYQNEWEGSNLNEGSYFYNLNIKTCKENKTYRGNLTILR